MILNALGRKWEFTFTTLVSFGGAFFASFPLFYSTSFGGAYWVWIVILLAFVVQAVAYEYRSKPNNILGKRTFEVFLFINGLLGTILIGAAVSTFFTGSQFSVSKMNITNLGIQGSNVISQWRGPAHGLEAALNIQNLSLGLTLFFLARVLGILYFMNNIDDEGIITRSKKQLIVNTVPFLVFFLFFTIRLMFLNGFAYDAITKIVSIESYKYFHNLLAMPAVLIMLLIGVVLVLAGIILPLLKYQKFGTKGIWFAGIGTVLTVMSVFLLAGFNHTAYYPSTFDLQNSLTIENSSSSKFTLVAMSYVSLLVPFVLAYIFYAWKSINNKQVTKAEMEEESHIY